LRLDTIIRTMAEPSAVTPECIRELIERPITFPLYGIVSENMCGCGNPECKAVGKHPLVLYRALEYPGALIGDCEGWGIKTGAAPDGSGIVALDADSEAAIAWVKEQGLPDTLTVRTGRGLQWWFQAPPFRVRSSSSQIYPKVDVKGFGGLVVGPGSPHKSGRRYELVTAVRPAPCPEWLLKWPELRSRSSETITRYPGDVSGAQLDHYKKKFIEYLESAPVAEQGERDTKLWVVVQKGALDLRLPNDVLFALVRDHYDVCKVRPPWGDELKRLVFYKADYAKTRSTRPAREPASYLKERVFAGRQMATPKKTRNKRRPAAWKGDV
jgi:hypothetical protein